MVTYFFVSLCISTANKRGLGNDKDSFVTFFLGGERCPAKNHLFLLARSLQLEKKGQKPLFSLSFLMHGKLEWCIVFFIHGRYFNPKCTMKKADRPIKYIFFLYIYIYIHTRITLHTLHIYHITYLEPQMTPCFKLEFLWLKNSLLHLRCRLQAVTLAMIALEPQCGKAPSQQLGGITPRSLRITIEIGKSKPKAWKKHPKATKKGI